MIKSLHPELVEIDPNMLRILLQDRGLSRYALASELHISTKTVQRWLNESVRRIRKDTLEKLALALNTPPEQLVKSSTTISTRATNKALEEICSKEFLKKIQANDEWGKLLTILRSFNPGSLSSEQRLKLFKFIGITSLYMRKYRACRIYLNQASSIAYALDLSMEMLDIFNWHALREQSMGNFIEAQRYFDKSEFLLNHSTNPATQALFYHKKARLLHYTEKYIESLTYNKKAVLIEYNCEKPNMLYISHKYFQMGITLLHLKEYSKARIQFMRCRNTAEKSGWVCGICLSRFYLGVIEKICNGAPAKIQSYFGASRSLARFTSEKRYDLRLDKMEFLYLLLHQNFEDCKNNVLTRLKKSRNSRLHFSYTVLDALFLNNLKPGIINMRHSYIEIAEDFFKRNQIQHSIRVLEMLRKKHPFNELDLLKIYPY